MADVKKALLSGLAGLGIIVGGCGLAILVADLGRRSAPPPAPIVVPPPAPAPAPPAPPRIDPFVRETALRLQDAAQRGAGLAAWRTASREVSYALLERGAEAHRGKWVFLTGRVVQIMDEADGSTMARIATKGRYDDIVYVVTDFAPSERVVEGARVVVPAILAGAHTYEAQSGWTITIPAAIGLAIVPKDEADREMRAVAR